MSKERRNNWVDLISGNIVPITSEGWPFIIIFFIATLLLFWWSTVLGFIGIGLTIWCASFFRDPARVTPQNDNLVIAPADGIVQKIDYAMPPDELSIEKEEMLRICIFMNVFNVHINRIPINGVLQETVYHPGTFLNAAVDKASTDNERRSYYMKSKNGTSVAFVQIAGLIARRIVTYATQENLEVRAGERFGLIRFGSRVDVYLPKELQPMVIVGQKTTAGETIIANLENTKVKLEGKVRGSISIGE